MKNKGQNQKLFLKNFPLKLLGFVLAVLFVASVKQYTGSSYNKQCKCSDHI